MSVNGQGGGVRTGDGQAQEFAEIHFGTRLDRRWATEMNVGQRAGRRGRRRRWVTEMMVFE
jgi:hypothetical protein